MYKILFYLTVQGENPVAEFVHSLPPGAQAKVTAYLQYLSEKGILVRHGYADILRNKIYELRPDFGHLCIRILYFYHGKNIILTNGFLKKTDKVSEEEINRAIRRMNEYLTQPERK